MNVLITGGSKGIGAAIAIEMAKAGHDLFLVARNETDLIAFKEHLLNQFPNIRVSIFAADLSEKNQIAKVADQINSCFDTLDVLVNNAGVFIPGLVTEEEDGQLEKMMNANLYSAYYLTKAVLPLIYKSNRAFIFNMCSVASLLAYPNGGSYSISKFALLGLSKALREELKPKNIKVTSVMPGATWSNSWKGVDLPKERLMAAEDVAKTIVHTMSLSDAAVVEEIIMRPQLGDL